MMVIQIICIHDYTCIKYQCIYIYISSGHAWCKVDSKNICNTGRLKTRKIICQLFCTCNCMKLSENKVQPRSHPLVNHYCSYSTATLGVYPVFRHTYMRASWNGSPKPWDSIYTHGRNLDDLEYPYCWKPPIFMYIINGWFSIASSDHWKVELRQECGRDWDIEKKLVSWRIAKSCIPKTSSV